MTNTNSNINKETVDLLNKMSKEDLKQIKELFEMSIDSLDSNESLNENVMDFYYSL